MDKTTRSERMHIKLRPSGVGEAADQSDERKYVFPRTGPAFSVGPHRPGRRRHPDNAVDRWDGKAFRRIVMLEGQTVELAVKQVSAHRGAAALRQSAWSFTRFGTEGSNDPGP